MRIKWFSMVRVTGLLLVLLYHFFKTTFSGGFIGVDVFFTFSGYLITALLIDEYTRSEHIDLLGFYKRRFYRIVPPLVLMVLVIIPFTYLVRSDFIASIGNQIAAAVGFTTNIYEIITGSNYETQFIPHLFVHTWSLAVEVHFYIIWGLLVWLLAKRHMHVNRFRSSIFMMSTVLFATGFLTMFISSFFIKNVSTIYFSTLSHSFPFYLGAMFATITGVKETTLRFKKNVRLWSKKYSIGIMVISFILLMLLTFSLDFNHYSTYLFGFVLASLFTSMMIYASRVLSDQTPDIEEPVIITYLADISYGLYLFHWPFYIIFGQLVNNWLAVFLTMIFSLIFSTLSYYVIEPYIAGKKSVFLGLQINLNPYKKWLYALAVFLGGVAVVTATMAPSVGKFETELLVGSLKQAQTNINRTHTLAAGDAAALSDISVIGDSVTLRSSTAFASLLPEAQIDAAVSRNFSEAFDIFQNRISSKTLSQTTVIAIGVNSLDDYKDNLQQFIDALPNGYRLIFMTPYNAGNLTQVKEVRNYELTLPETYHYVTVADWYKVATDNPSIWAGTDGVHYSDSDDTGANLYVSTIQKAIQKSAKAPAKGESKQ